MDGSQNDPMNRIGVCEWCLPVNGPAALEFAGSVGYEGLQLRDLGGAAKGYPLNNEYIRELYREAAQRSGVIMHSLHMYTLAHTDGSIHPMNSPAGELATEGMRYGIETCEALQIPCINFSACFAGAIKDDYDFRNFLDHMVFAVEYAADRGVKVAYEPGVSMEKLEQMLEEAPGITFNYDIHDCIKQGRGFEVPRVFGIERIDHVHLKDFKTPPPGSRASCPCLAGEGYAHIKEGIAVLKKLGYTGWILAESGYVYGERPPMSFGCGTDFSKIAQKDYEGIVRMLQEC